MDNNIGDCAANEKRTGMETENDDRCERGIKEVINVKR